MGVTSGGGVSLGRSRISLRGGAQRTELNAGTAAWLAAVPCAVLTYVAVVTLGRRLGDLLFPSHATFDYLGGAAPDPSANAREVGPFLVSLGGPILLALAIVALTRRRLTLPRVAVVGAVALAQAVLVVVIVACVRGPTFGYFNSRTLLASMPIAALLLLACRSRRLRGLLGARVHEDRRVRLAVGALVVAVTVTAMFPAVQSDVSITGATDVIQYHTAFYMDETFAVMNGLTPLVTFTPQYGGLWPYLVAIPLLVFGKTLLVFTAAMATATAAAFLGIFGVLRRVTRNSLAALLLFVPFLAMTSFRIGENPTKLFSLTTSFAIFPLRFAGPLLAAWLTARHLSRARRRRPWPLFALAGLVVMNNTDMGVAAAGATLAALLWTEWPRTRAQALALAGNVVGGFALGIALVSTVTLVRSGSLPHVDQLTEFARIFALNGGAAVPMPSVRGLSLIIYVTYAAAIVTGTALAVRGDRDRVLAGMLVWTGVFGLGAAIYYVARDSLPITFTSWALAIVLLAAAMFRSASAGRLRGQAPMALLVFFGLAVISCSVAQLPKPFWSEVGRLSDDVRWESVIQPPLAAPVEPDVRRFLISIADGPRRFVVRHGAPAVILATNGHRIADAYGIRDVTPYTGFESLFTVEQVERMLDALRDAGGNTVLMPRIDNVALNRMLVRRGFEVVTDHGLRVPHFKGPQDWEAIQRLTPTTVGNYVKWVDTRAIRSARP
jgi:hypothetical protein